MIPQSWDDVAGAVALFTQGFRLARKCWHGRDGIRARVILTAGAVGCRKERAQEKIHRDWLAFNGMPLLARLGIGTLFLNLAVALIWNITAGTIPVGLNVYPVLGMTLLALYAAYLGVRLTGRRMKRLAWQR